MKRYIAHLRTKPESHRKKVAFGVSAGITAIIALFWVTSFSYFNGEVSTEVARKNSENSPLNVVRKNIAGAYEAITGAKVQFVKEQDPVSAGGVLEYVPESEAGR